MSGQGYHLTLNRDQVDEILSCNGEMGILDWVDQALGSAIGMRDSSTGATKTGTSCSAV